MNEWENSFAVVTGMVEVGRDIWERGPRYRVVRSGLSLKAAQRLANEVGGHVVAPGGLD